MILLLRNSNMSHKVRLVLSPVFGAMPESAETPPYSFSPRMKYGFPSVLKVILPSCAVSDIFDNVPFFVSEYPMGKVSLSGSLTVTVTPSADLTTPLLFMK